MKKASLIRKIIMVVCLLIPVVLICFPRVWILGFSYYYNHYSTEAKLQKYIKTNNIEKLKKLKLYDGINGYYTQDKFENIILESATPLVYAIRANNVEAVNFFIKNGADVNFNGTFGDRKFTTQEQKPIHIAVEKENKEIINILIKNGANVNVKNGLKETPLSIAKEKGNTEIIELLIANGAKE